VDAFKATLEETVLADLICHVVDGSESDTEREQSAAAVDSVLEEIGAGSKPRLLGMNKIDLLDGDQRSELRMRHPDAVLVSAQTGEGLDDLRKRISTQVLQGLIAVELLVPYEDGDRLSQLHEVAGDLEREDRQDGVLVRALLPAGIAERFSDLSVNGSLRGRAGARGA
jgi:GTPase